MDGKQSILATLGQSDFAVHSFLKDLTDAELFARPCSGANHIAWQLGHLISSERYLVEQVAPGSMPALPEGFVEKHKKDMAGNNDPAGFYSKDEYVRLSKEVRDGTLRLLAKITPEQLDQPVTKVPPFCKTKGEALLFIGGHWTMHAGQWSVIRRSLGRAPLF